MGVIETGLWRHGYDVTPLLLRGLGCNLRRAWGHQTPQQQRPRSPSALTGDSTRGPAHGLKCRGTPGEQTRNFVPRVSRSLSAHPLGAALHPVGGLLPWLGATGAALPPRPLGSQELPDQCILPRQPAPLFFTTEIKKRQIITEESVSRNRSEQQPSPSLPHSPPPWLCSRSRRPANTTSGARGRVLLPFAGPRPSQEDAGAAQRRGSTCLLRAPAPSRAHRAAAQQKEALQKPNSTPKAIAPTGGCTRRAVTPREPWAAQDRVMPGRPVGHCQLLFQDMVGKAEPLIPEELVSTRSTPSVGH